MERGKLLPLARAILRTPTIPCARQPLEERTMRLCLTLTAASLAATAIVAGPAAAATCESLAGVTLPNTTITLAQSFAGGTFTAPNGQKFANIPAFCEVHGIAAPTSVSAINFEIWMPAAGWNGRFEGVGNGGLAGTISFGAMASALTAGYATASTDTGHTPTEPQTWLENRELVIDYSYRGLHLTTANAKALIAAFYGTAARFSYYTGCSTGGKQALMEAQRFPEDYDGIIGGDAANFWTHQMMSEVWDGQASDTPDTDFTPANLQLLQTAVLAQCAGQDGGLKADAFLMDPRDCHFDPKVLECKAGQDPSTCLTAAQVGAARKIYQGPSNPRTGASLYPGIARGGEVGWGPAGGQFVINRTTTSGVSSFDWFRFAVFQNPNWDFRTFNFDSDATLTDEEWAAIANSTNPDLAAFRRRGHKMIYYHGFADPLIPTVNGINYYESVVAEEGEGRGDHDRGGALEETREFFRAFMVPGMYHCAGGPGPTIFLAASGAQADAEHDMLSALVEWVERGQAPKQIIATKFVNDNPANGIAFQRPLCPYPEFAAYRGFGDPNSAQSFRCVRDDRDLVAADSGHDHDRD
jgi:feruloyl esterase